MPASFTGEVGISPSVRTYRLRHAVDAAAGTDFSEVVFVAEFAGTITGVRYIPDAAVSGATATANTLSLLNKTQTLTAAALAFIVNVDWVAFTSKVITLGTAANVVVAVGDVFSFAKTHASTGTAGPAGLLEVDVTRGDTL